MAGVRRKGRIGWAVPLLGFALALALPLADGAAQRKPVRKKGAVPSVAASPKTALPLDENAYTEAHRSLDSGNLDHSLQRFCDAMSLSKAEGFTLNLVLLSDPSSVGSAVRGLRANRKEPIFVVRKMYRGTPCYGILLGLFPTKEEANRLATSLPASLRKARPYPSPVALVCELCPSPPEAPPGEEQRGEEPGASAPEPALAALPDPPVHEGGRVPEEPLPAATVETPRTAESPSPVISGDPGQREEGEALTSPFQPQPAPLLQETLPAVPSGPSSAEETGRQASLEEKTAPESFQPADVVVAEAPAPILEVVLPPHKATAILERAGGFQGHPKYREAHRAIQSGDPARAAKSFCDALRPEPSSSWSLSVVLICEPEAVAGQVLSLESAVKEAVFVLPKEYRGQTCYRLCFGIRPDRTRAAHLKELLPKGWEKASPFPFSLRDVCGAPPPVERSAGDALPNPLAASEDGGGATSVAASLPEPVPSTVAQVPPPEEENESSQKPPERAPDPKQGESWFQQGLQAQAQGRGGEAIEAYERALSFQPEKPEVLNNLGVLYLQQKEFAAAKDLLKRAVNASPGYGRARLNLAGALWGLGEQEAALKQAKEAALLLGGDASAHLTLASFLAAAGRREEAVAEAKVVLALEPGNREAEKLISEIAP